MGIRRGIGPKYITHTNIIANVEAYLAAIMNSFPSIQEFISCCNTCLFAKYFLFDKFMSSQINEEISKLKRFVITSTIILIATLLYQLLSRSE